MRMGEKDTVYTSYTPASQARLYTPLGLTIDGEGTIYFADSLNQVVRRVGPNGIITEKYALGCVPTANFGENIIMSGTPAGVRRPQSLYK